MEIQDNLKEQGIGYAIGKRGFSGDRPTLVMIHGAGGSTTVWQNQVTFLDKEMNVLERSLEKLRAKAVEIVREMQPTPYD